MLDVQSDHLGGLDTRVVVPLCLSEKFSIRIRNLNPSLEVAGKSVVMDTASIAAIPNADLRRAVLNLSSDQLDIQNALDTLFGGY